MKGRLLDRALVVLASSVMFAVGTSLASANEQDIGPDAWQSFDNQVITSQYAQSIQANRKQFRSNLKYGAKSVFDSVGLSERSARYVGSAIGLATQDTTIHLNDSKTFSLDLLDMSENDRTIFFGYKKSW